MSMGLFLFNTFAFLLPETRLYAIKAGLLRACGYTVEGSVRIVSSVKFRGTFNLSVGFDTFIGHEVLIAGGNSKISIGNNCDLGPRTCIITGTHDIDMIGFHSAGAGISKDIFIEDGVWMGANVTVLGGVRIGRKAVIAAGSVVTQDIPPFVIAAGVPCRPVKRWNPVTMQFDSFG